MANPDNELHLQLKLATVGIHLLEHLDDDHVVLSARRRPSRPIGIPGLASDGLGLGQLPAAECNQGRATVMTSNTRTHLPTAMARMAASLST